MKHRLLILILGLSLAGVLLAHDDQFEDDRLPPYVGPGLYNPDAGRAILNFPADNVSLLAWLPLAELDPTAFAGNDCWGYTSPSGREYALVGTSGGTAFVEVTNPGDPVHLTTIPGAIGSWRDIKTYQDHAYAVDESDGGIQVFDLSAIDDGVVRLTNTVLDTNGTHSTHNVAIDEVSGYLYRCGGDFFPTEGLRIYDLTDKDAPQFVARYDARYVHDAQVVTYPDGPYAGRQIAFCFSDDNAGGGSPGIDILDVTDKNAITPLSETFYPGGAFSHQGWLSPDRQYVYFNDEVDEIAFGTDTTTRILDVSDLTAPFLAGDFSSGTTSIDHNLYTRGNRIYEANYRSGLRVFDSTDPLNPVQIAFFDTFMEDDFANFNGLWSNYPYFASGTVVGSDIEKGLFVWRIGQPPLKFDFESDAAPDLVRNRGGKLQVHIQELSRNSLVGGSPTLHLDRGNGFESIRMHKGPHGTYVGQLPKLDCEQSIRYFFSAGSPDGVTWREPQGAPLTFHSAVVSDSRTVHYLDDLEVDRGWIVGDPADTAFTGIWELVDPIGTAAQPEDDVTPDPGVQCWVTGQGSLGGGLGENDIDGGRTTLVSPPMDATVAPDGYVSYWRWYSNTQGASPFEDVFVIEISNDDGATWLPLETVGPAGDEVSGGWIFKQFKIADLLAPTRNVRLRFIAADDGSGSVVEAAVDEVQITSFDCRRGGKH